MSPSTHPSAFELVEYWLDAAGESPLEEHLLACSACGERLAWLAALGEAVPALVRRGEALLVLTAGVLARLAAAGVSIREYRLAPGGSVNCTIAPEDDVVVARLRAPLDGVQRLDLVALAEGFEHRLEDVPFDAASGEVVVAQQSPRLRALGHGTEVARLIAVGAHGETVIGEYTFRHSPSGHAA